MCNNIQICILEDKVTNNETICSKKQASIDFSEIFFIYDYDGIRWREKKHKIISILLCICKISNLQYLYVMQEVKVKNNLAANKSFDILQNTPIYFI